MKFRDLHRWRGYWCMKETTFQTEIVYVNTGQFVTEETCHCEFIDAKWEVIMKELRILACNVMCA